jgi:hypothetical protein
MEYTLKRPQRIADEDEDDILAFQEEFLRKKSEIPAAKVIKVNNEASNQRDETNKDSDKKNKVIIDCRF